MEASASLSDTPRHYQAVTSHQLYRRQSFSVMKSYFIMHNIYINNIYKILYFSNKMMDQKMNRYLIPHMSSSSILSQKRNSE